MIISLNGVDLDFKMTDADFYEKYMESAAKMDECMDMALTDEEREDYRKIADLFRKKCHAVKNFLDDLFGEGTGEKVCGKADDIEICWDVYAGIIRGVAKQGMALQNKMAAYSGNRPNRNKGKRK